MGFTELGLGEKVLEAIEDMGFKEPTPIQEAAIPIALMGRDVLGLAQTGTGKTASFTLPMIEMLAGGRAKARMPRSLILTPTRELAAQIAEHFDQFGKYHKLTKTLLTGGSSMGEQIKELEQGVDVLIATPGRLLDLFGRGNIILADIKILVIDEADRMLDMGFIPDLEKIVSLIPPLRQTLFFSATMPKAISKLADQYLSNPKTIKVAATSKPAENVEQFMIRVPAKDKPEALKSIITQENVQNAFIFCNRKRDIEGVEKSLSKLGYKVGSIHGDIEQKYRTRTLDDFRSGEISLLVCSDVVARGIDISGVSHVFNYDVPMNAEDYIHRIGRTGRAGKSGRAFMLVAPSDKKFLTNVENLVKKPIEEISLDGSKKAPKPAPEAKDDDDKIEGDKKPASKKTSAKKEDSPKVARIKTASEVDKDSSKKSEKPASAQKSKDKKPETPTNESSANKNVQGFGDEVPAFFKA
jgi:superfamily II DNA/RNA helicase